jgi:hypothetical protein
MPDERDHPPLDELADDEDELDGCEIDFSEYAVDELGQLEVVLLGDTPPGTPEAEAKLRLYRELREASDESPT